MCFFDSRALEAYVIGIALGDGNLSSPNGRVVRLRIACDPRYPNLIRAFQAVLQKVFPNNKVSLVNNPKSIDISVYSNRLKQIMPWKVGGGAKTVQSPCVPNWIQVSRLYTVECLRGLFQTDGSIYEDRGYLMVNFVTVIATIANDVMSMIQRLGFAPHLYRIRQTRPHFDRYNIRLSKSAQEFIDEIRLFKSWHIQRFSAYGQQRPLRVSGSVAVYGGGC